MSLSIIECGENENKNHIVLKFVMKFWVWKNANIRPFEDSQEQTNILFKYRVESHEAQL